MRSHLTFLALVLVAWPLWPSAVRAQAFVRSDVPGTRCTLAPEGDRDAIQRCTAAGGTEATMRFACTVLTVGDVHPDEGLESVVSCTDVAAAPDSVPAGLVAVRATTGFVYARRLPDFGGASADLLRLRATDAGLRDVLLYVGDEDGVRLYVVGFTRMIMDEMWAGDVASPESATRVRYEPGSPAFIETVETVPEARPIRRRFRWRPGEALFSRIAGPP
jgi:hypothetical protein